MGYPKVSIIFTNYNGGQNPLRCISSINTLNYLPELLEIIVIGNHSTDRSTKAIKRKHPKVKLLYQKRNLGFAGAVNIGIKKATGKYLFITNDDIVFEKNSLKILVDYAQNHPEIGIIGGKQIKPQTPKINIGGRNFNLFTGKPSAVCAKKPTECDAIDGCTMLIPRKVIAKVGLFDRGFYPVIFEDLDYCFRAKKAGFSIVYHPKATFIHHYAQSISKLPPDQLYYINFKNKLRFLIKHSSPIQLISFLISHYLVIMPSRIIFYREPIFRPELKAIIWNIKNIKKTLSARKSL